MKKFVFVALARKKRDEKKVDGVEIDMRTESKSEAAVKKHAHGSRKIFTVIKRSLKVSLRLS